MYGHSAGDLALQAVVRRAEASLRQGDWLGRLGGDEFIAVLPGTTDSDGFAVADRIRRAIASDAVAVQTREIPVSVSAGVAFLPGGTPGTFAALIEAADRALYESKRRGGNQTVLHEFDAPRDQHGPERADPVRE